MINSEQETTTDKLPQKIYRVSQTDFEKIPRSPWAYWVSTEFRSLFQTLPSLSDVVYVKLGLSSVDMARFYRYWWETGINQKWWILEKGGETTKWYMCSVWVTNWENNGIEQKTEVIMRYPYLKGNYGLKIRDEEWQGREGLTYSRKGGRVLSTRYMPSGRIFEDNGPAIILDGREEKTLEALAVMNSSVANAFSLLMNPGIDFQKGDIERIPLILEIPSDINKLVLLAITSQKYLETQKEPAYDFIIPPIWHSGAEFIASIQNRLTEIKVQVDGLIFDIYKINRSDRVAIEAELSGELLSEDEGEGDDETEDSEIDKNTNAITLKELAVYWISYSIGMVLGRFRPGIADSLGSAIYRSSDFAIGSLPTPDEAEFDELVGPAEQFAFVDEDSGRHVFSAQVEQALQSLALPDGIAVFDEGHPRDLPALVEKALNLMLGEQAAREIIREATGGDSSISLSASLRKFLEKDFFTGWHFKWYRKRPVYWPIQSSKRAYGFVLFHEKIAHDTFYAIQREPYLDTKRNAISLKMADLQASLARATGTAAKKIEKELDDLRKLSDELAEFAKELEAITMGGYEPEPNWIDDGVILRMAPLWKVIPIWKSEPKKYWERLAAGDLDWSHIAMKYWPKRVRDKCKTNKSYAIAHGHEEWYQG